jgi:hypothetical protein
MPTSVAGNAVHALSKGNNSLPHGGLVSLMVTHPMLSFKCRMADYHALYTFHCYIHEQFIYILHGFILKGQHRQCPHRYYST